MQKAIRLNILARNNAAKSSRKAKQREAREAWSEWHQVTNRQRAIQGEFKTEERLTRREDWIAGPLAPNRNAGTQRGIYGTVDSGLTQLAEIPKSVRGGPKQEGYAIRPEPGVKGAKKGFSGKTIVGNVVEGDRVVIIAGPERLKGLIGYVNHVDLDKEEVKLRNINTTDVAYPSSLRPAPNPNNPEPAKYTSVDVAIPMSHVRLVVELTHDLGDAIIRHVHAGPPYIQREIGSNLPSHTRYATGLFDTVDEEGKTLDPGTPQDDSMKTRKVPVVLPWPAASFPGRFEHFEGDTQRSALARPTWTVSLLGSPLGYRSDVPSTVELGDSPYTRAPHLSTIDVKGTNGLPNAQRVGLDGFVSYSKLLARQEKIAAGILNELRGNRKLKPRFDDVGFVKRQMLEDARAIWYQDRKLSSPQSQAVELAVEQKTKEREKQIFEQRKERLDEIAQLAAQVQLLKVEGKELVTEIILKDLRGRKVKAPGFVGFTPDKNLSKKISPMITHTLLNATEPEKARLAREMKETEKVAELAKSLVREAEKTRAELEDMGMENSKPVMNLEDFTRRILGRRERKARRRMEKETEREKLTVEMKRLGAKLRT